VLATDHGSQKLGNRRNGELERRLEYLYRNFGVQLFMEEWASNQGESVAKEVALRLDIKWVNIGTPEEPQYRTYTGPIDYPGHDGPFQDSEAPTMYAYGPFDNQEARENRMTENIIAAMKHYGTGLLVIGLAHLHSLTAKLNSAGFSVNSFQWLGGQ